MSDSFPAELSMVLNCGRGTAVWRARRARVWSALLSQTFAALKRGELDERRARELFDALQSARSGAGAAGGRGDRARRRAC